MNIPVIAQAAIAILILLASAPQRARGASLSPPAPSLRLALDEASGAYTVQAANPNWSLAGTIGAPLSHVATSAGNDAVGAYRQLDFEWSEADLPKMGFIRLYLNQPLALFSDTNLVAAPSPSRPFPDFIRIPPMLHAMSYADRPFAPPQMSVNQSSTPVLLFDDRANAILLSPASHFMISRMTGDGTKELASGFNPALHNLPAHFEHRTLLAVSPGINRTFDLWGHALTDLQGKVRPGNQADITLRYLGYWTDNGSHYYYNYDPSKGYAATLVEVLAHARAHGIPVRYLQLDSWWYEKTFRSYDGKTTVTKNSKLPAGEWNRYGGLLDYHPDPFLFPQGLREFQKQIDMPLVTHNRWIDPASPYQQRYHCSGLAAVDPKFWADLASDLHDWGVATYEQDWLNYMFKYSPELSSDPGLADVLLDSMASACADRGITLQYCMPLPAHFLQGSKYAGLTSIRTSDDRFEPARWSNFVYCSRLADSVGIWPFADVLRSGERDNLLLSLLSAGPVGIGDEMGAEDPAMLSKAVRADGVLLKPDAPIVPLDQSYISNAHDSRSPVLASTYVDHSGFRTAYLFAFQRPNLSDSTSRQPDSAFSGRQPGTEGATFTLNDLAVRAPAYLVDGYTNESRRISKGDEPIEVQLTPTDSATATGSDAKKKAAAQTLTAFYIAAPVTKSGIAFLGEANAFVGMSKLRIASIDDTSEKLSIDLIFAQAERSMALQGCAPFVPRVEITSGSADPVHYDPQSQHFTVKIYPDLRTQAEHDPADGLRHVHVYLSR